MELKFDRRELEVIESSLRALIEDMQRRNIETVGVNRLLDKVASFLANTEV